MQPAATAPPSTSPLSPLISLCNSTAINIPSLPLNFPCRLRRDGYRAHTHTSRRFHAISPVTRKASNLYWQAAEPRCRFEAMETTVDLEKSDEPGGCVTPTSPKQKLGSRWREYQGCNKWEGLLDPLDEELRNEIIRYGEFVHATYVASDLDPQSKTYGLCKYSKRSLLWEAGLRNCGYKVTQHLRATSSVHIPQWLDTMLSSYTRVDDTYVTRRTSWIGFVAVCEDEREVARLGRRDIVVAYRGTVTPLEWVENLKDILTPMAYTSEGSDGQSRPRVQSGFWSLYSCKDSRGRSAETNLREEILRLLELYRGEDVSITITGHSLGAALALLSAYQLGGALQGSGIPVTVISFGGPRVGNREFGRRMEEMGIKVLRIANTQDVITKVPGLGLNEWMQYQLMKKQQSSEVGRMVVRVLENMYWHVGTEFRVNSKHSPYLRTDADMSCCHDLEAYLHLIDGFMSSNVPFRSTAKRDILRLLVNQKSNVLLNAARLNRHSEGETELLP